jgi:hypothetical protein
LNYKIQADAVLSEFKDGQAVLLDLTRKQYHRLNATGGFIWRALERGDEADAVVRALCEEFDVSEESARASLARFASGLVEMGLLAEDA